MNLADAIAAKYAADEERGAAAKAQRDAEDPWVDDPFAQPDTPKVRRSMSTVHPADRPAAAVARAMGFNPDEETR